MCTRQSYTPPPPQDTTIEPNTSRRASIRTGYDWEEYISGAFLPDDLKKNVPESGSFQDTTNNAFINQYIWVFNDPSDFYMSKFSVTQ